MAVLLADNAYGTLGSGLLTTDTTLTFSLGHGARFPAVVAPDELYCCILNSSNILEEIIITAHTANADTATILRAQGATTAKAWNTGDRIEARWSSTMLGDITVRGTSAGATNISGGSAGVVVFQVGTSSTGFTALGTASQVMISGGTGIPAWLNQSALVVGSAAASGTAALATVANIASTSTKTLGSPQNDNGVLAIGSFFYAQNSSGVGITSGSTVAGTSLSGGGGNLGSGTWRNVEGGTIGVSAFGNFQRIS